MSKTIKITCSFEVPSNIDVGDPSDLLEAWQAFTKDLLDNGGKRDATGCEIDTTEEDYDAVEQSCCVNWDDSQ